MSVFPLNGWPKPERITLEGKYCRLEPIQLTHSDRLYELVTIPSAEERYRYISNLPPKSREEHEAWIRKEVTSEEFITFVIVNKRTGEIEGRQSLMRIFPEHGSVEIGYVCWGLGMSRTRIATEALFLFASYVFDTLKYRRFEWKCDNANEPSKRAALRFGFQAEGLFRQHMIIKGVNRDTAWFAMLDFEWQKVKDSFVSWLDESNFDEEGNQIHPLTYFRT